MENPVWQSERLVSGHFIQSHVLPARI